MKDEDKVSTIKFKEICDINVNTGGYYITPYNKTESNSEGYIDRMSGGYDHTVDLYHDIIMSFNLNKFIMNADIDFNYITDMVITSDNHLNNNSEHNYNIVTSQSYKADLFPYCNCTIKFDFKFEITDTLKRFTIAIPYPMFFRLYIGQLQSEWYYFYIYKQVTYHFKPSNSKEEMENKIYNRYFDYLRRTVFHRTF